MPDQNETAWASSRAARSMARRRKSIRTARREGSGSIRVGSCFFLGLRRKRAPVSTTRESPRRSRASRTESTCERQGGGVFIRVEGPGVERQGDALVSLVGEQGDGVEEAVVRQAVGVVAEPHEASLASRQVE